MKKNILTTTLLSFVFLTACTDEDIYKESPSYTQADQFYQTEDDFTKAIYGVYQDFKQAGFYAGNGYSRDLVIVGDILSDNLLSNYGGRGSNRAANNWTFDASQTPTDIYIGAYKIITDANLILGKIDHLKAGDFKDRIQSEAKVARAIAHFEIARHYAEIPTQSSRSNSSIGIPYLEAYNPEIQPARTKTIEEVYSKIIADIEEALPYLDTNSKITTRINRHAAQGFLTRVYLYTGNYLKVIEHAQPVISQVNPVSKTDQADFWRSKMSTGVLFEIPFPLTNDISIGSGFGYGTNEKNMVMEFSVDKALYDLYDPTTEPERFNAYFKIYKLAGDAGFQNIIVNKYFESQVKNYVNNARYLRVEEVIFNLAEAYYLTGQSALALKTLNQLRDQRYSHYPGKETGDHLFHAIITERRKELAFENGDRWFTLKRLLGVTKAPSSYHKGLQRSGNGYRADGSGSAPIQLFLKADDYRWQLPLPIDAIHRNPNLKQNKGY